MSTINLNQNERPTSLQVSRLFSLPAGTKEDPIPYNNNMRLELGKYYSQDGVVYLCFRDSEQAVYNPLKDLVDIYVKVAE